MKSVQKKVLLSLATIALCTSTLPAADWLTLAGTQPCFVKKNGKKVENHNNKPHLWGFAQVGYQKNYGDIFIPATGPKKGLNLTPFSMLTPNLDSQAGFEVNRARLGVRGMFDKANTVNYFFLLELGEDGITRPAGHPSHNYLTDASITYTGLDYVNVRVGQFKYPGSEEGMRAVLTSEYRNFSTAGGQLLLERFLPNDATEVRPGFFQAAPEQSVNAYRDRGIELFHTEQINPDLKVSVAGMIGNGTGLSSLNSSGELTYYGYLSSEYSFHKGRSYFTQAVKGFGWYQTGKRQLNNTKYKRERYGVGVDYFKDGLRIDVEYIAAKGMIYNGAKDVDADIYGGDWQYQIAADESNEADGGYISMQYYVVPKKWELLARYDYLDRLSNSVKDEREFKTTTLGMSYHFKGPTRIDVNYALRDATAPGNAKAQHVLDNIGNLLSVQATVKF